VGCREALSSILANSTYLNRRIDDLMALARSSNGRLDLEREILDLNLVATEAMAEVRSLAKVNRVIARFEPLAYPVQVDGDRKRLRQCLMILLDNAVKFSRASQVVEVVLDVRGPSAAMTVVDQGNGIAARDLPSIFERFYQAEVGRRAGGTGLGLAIAHRIVEAHGGDISAASREQGGTAVTMTLPLQKGAGQ
jgi:Signal transduction histidine kinase